MITKKFTSKYLSDTPKVSLRLSVSVGHTYCSTNYLNLITL